MEIQIYVRCVRENRKAEKKTGQKIEKAEEEGGIENRVMAQIDSMGEIVKKLQETHSLLKKI